MKFILVTSLILFAQSVIGQNRLSKPLIDTNTYRKWSYPSAPAISSDGKYSMYTIENKPQGNNTLVVTSIDSKWKREFVGADDPRFTNDSKAVIFKNSDCVNLYSLRSNDITKISNIESYVISNSINDQWLAYKMDKNQNTLVTRNLNMGKEVIYKNIHEYQFSESGYFLVLKEVKDSTIDLQLVNLKTGSKMHIWNGKNPNYIYFDKTNTQIAFSSDSIDSFGKTERKIWIYNIKNHQTSCLIDDNEISVSKGLRIESIQNFSNDGKRLFFTAKENIIYAKNSELVPLNIWHYKDKKLQSQQLNISNRDFDCLVNIENSNVIRLENENENLQSFSNTNSANDEYDILEINNGGDQSEIWNSESILYNELISKVDGTRIRVPTGGSISPNNKFYIYYDIEKHNYFSFEIVPRITRNITENISVSWVTKRNSLNKLGQPLAISGWLTGDQAVLLHDEFDIWQVDPQGIKKAIQITNGIGKQNQIFFERISENWDPIKPGRKIILSAFNRISKDNNFYCVIIGRQSDPKKLSREGSWYYYAPKGAFGEDGSNFEPIKALNTDVYIVRRMSATESPNYYATRDFTTFTRLSYNNPERQYNWYTTELHTWISFKGRSLKGILYKPEDFDPNKKYPVIFQYYDIMSDRLNCFLIPKPSNGRLNIAWYVSNGYLIFTPDIEYNIGDPFNSTYDCVVSAASYLSGYPFVNDKRMGIQGISWGGVQTNYLVTHTKIFAAACAASSISDFISDYNGLGHGDHSGQTKFETGPYRVGSTLWEDPNWYIENSPVMSANKVTTPLLMFQTTIDGATRFSQAVEMFSALRRLRKKVWLLEYADGQHSVRGKSAMDFDLRMQQFFNYYLKDKYPPKWMTIGREAKFKSVLNQFEIDSSGAIP